MNKSQVTAFSVVRIDDGYAKIVSEKLIWLGEEVQEKVLKYPVFCLR